MKSGNIIYPQRQQPLLRPWLAKLKGLLTVKLPRAVKNIQRVSGSATASRGLPRGTFSALEMLERGEVEGRVLLRDQGRPTAAPDSIMVRSKLGQHQEQPWPVFWTHHKNIHLSGSSLIPRNVHGQLCAEAGYRPASLRDDPSYWHNPGSSPTHLKGNWTSVLSRWIPQDRIANYAHWLFDALPRLAVLPEFPPDTRVLVPAQLPRFATETLGHLNLQNRCRPTPETDLLVEDFYFSAPTSMIVCYNPYAVEFLRKSFLPLSRPADNSPKKIFVQRTGRKRSAEKPEELHSFFQARGWHLCDTAQMSFTEQVSLFASADAVCGVHGAGFSNCAWCRPGTKIIELFCDRYLSGCFEWLAQAVQADYHALVFPTNENICAKIDLGAVKMKLDALGL